MPHAPDVAKCANLECNRRFHRLGEGKIWAFPVEDPKPWGLPAHLRQKVVWLCDECAELMYVRLDRKHHAIHLVRKAVRRHVA
jgi:hypothetical protein